VAEIHDNRRDFSGAGLAIRMMRSCTGERAYNRDFSYVQALPPFGASVRHFAPEAMWHLASDESSYVFLARVGGEQIAVAF
jgi:hypothetical protein